METLIEQLERGRIPTKPIPPPNRIIREPIPWAFVALLVLMVAGSVAAVVWAVVKMA